MLEEDCGTQSLSFAPNCEVDEPLPSTHTIILYILQGQSNEAISHGLKSLK